MPVVSGSQGTEFKETGLSLGWEEPGQGPAGGLVSGELKNSEQSESLNQDDYIRISSFLPFHGLIS